MLRHRSHWPTAAAWLDEIEARLDPLTRQMLRQDRQLLTQIMDGIAVIDALLKELATEDERCQQLDTISGCGVVTAAAVVAEVVTSRASPGPKHCAGMPPDAKVEQSGERTITGKLVRHCNKHLRRALIIIAQSFVKSARVANTRLKAATSSACTATAPIPPK